MPNELLSKATATAKDIQLFAIVDNGHLKRKQGAEQPTTTNIFDTGIANLTDVTGIYTKTINKQYGTATAVEKDHIVCHPIL